METLTREEIVKRKMQSRTFWLVVAWCSFVPLSIIAAVLVAPVVATGGMVAIPIAAVVTAAATITSLYMAGEKGVKALRTKNGGNGFSSDSG